MSREKDIQNTLRMANAIVLVKEANDLTKLTNKFNLLAEMKRPEAETALTDLQAETERQRRKENELYDEEEVIVYYWLKRKK